MEKDERDFYLWLHNTLKIKDRKREKKSSQNNANNMDYIAIKIEEVENKIAELEINDPINIDIATYKSQPLNNISKKREQFEGAYTVFDKMRKIGKDSVVGFYFDDYYTKQFYEQAKFMKDVEDDFNQVIAFDSYRPIYAYMDNLQLRTYFTWRTKVRHDIIENINWSYVQIYIYEIINKAYNIPIEECLDLLLTLWTNYRRFDQSIDRYFCNCIKDFYICNDFDCSYSEIAEKFPISESSYDINKEQIIDKKYEGMLHYVNSVSSYKVVESIFYKTEYGALIDNSMPYVFRELDHYFEINNIDFTQILIGKPTNNTWWKPFRNAVYHDNNSMKDKKVEISRTEKYVLSLGRWKSVTYDGGIKYRKLIGFILKAIESKVRSFVRFKYKLKPNIDAAAVDYFTDKQLVGVIRNKAFMDAISRGVELYLLENNTIILKNATSKIEQKDIIKKIEQEKRVEIIIDSSKFDDIRKKAENIQDRLIVDDGIDIIKDKMSTIVDLDSKDKVDLDSKVKVYLNSKAKVAIIDSDSPKDKTDLLHMQKEVLSDEKQAIEETMTSWEQLVHRLTKVERDIIENILNVKDELIDLKLIAKNNNLLIEVIIESINEKAIDLIGDNIIDIDNEKPYVYEDYVINIGNALLKGE